MNIVTNKFSSQFSTNFLIDSRETLLLTHSGGQDSTLLGIWLLLLQNQYNYYLLTVYCNHLWQISSISVLIHLKRLNFAHQTTFISPSTFKTCLTENQARQWRYSILTRLACFTSYKYSIVGHTQTDQIESFFLNLYRGTSPIGSITLKKERMNFFNKFICFTDKKCFINENYKVSFKNNNKSNLSLTIIWRPLLYLNRFEIYHLLQILNLPLWTDQTNFKVKYRRNRIRYQLLPYLRFYFNPNLDLALTRYINTLIYTTNHLKKISRQIYKKKAFFKLGNSSRFYYYSEFKSYPDLYKKIILHETLKELNLVQINTNQLDWILKLLILSQNKKHNHGYQVLYIINGTMIGCFNYYIFIHKL